MSTASPGTAAVHRRREGGRWATVGGAAVAATVLLGVLVLLDYRVAARAGGVGITRKLAAAFVATLPVAALVAVGLSTDRALAVGPLRVAVRAGLATGLYAAIVALVFLSLANLRVLLAAAGEPDPLVADLLANGVLLLFSFPTATTVGLVLGYLVALPLARST